MSISPDRTYHSRDLADYTITVKAVENNYWQAQLVELPEVITCAQSWTALHMLINDALHEYVSDEASRPHNKEISNP